MRPVEPVDSVADVELLLSDLIDVIALAEEL
jgi:hypothetical protein